MAGNRSLVSDSKDDAPQCPYVPLNNVDLPEDITCPLSGDIFFDPVILPINDSICRTVERGFLKKMEHYPDPSNAHKFLVKNPYNPNRYIDPDMLMRSADTLDRVEKFLEKNPEHEKIQWEYKERNIARMAELEAKQQASVPNSPPIYGQDNLLANVNQRENLIPYQPIMANMRAEGEAPEQMPPLVAQPIDGPLPVGQNSHALIIRRQQLQQLIENNEVLTIEMKDRCRNSCVLYWVSGLFGMTSPMISSAANSATLAIIGVSTGISAVCFGCALVNCACAVSKKCTIKKNNSEITQINNELGQGQEGQPNPNQAYPIAPAPFQR